MGDTENSRQRFYAGLITQEELEREADRLKEANPRLADETEGLATVMGLDAENEVAARNFGPTAELLSSDPHHAARQGMSKESWIAEVIAGHAGDDAAQIGCLLRIIELSRNGSWPWLREER